MTRLKGEDFKPLQQKQSTILAPKASGSPVPVCEAPFCPNDGNFGFKYFRGAKGYHFCGRHKDHADEYIKEIEANAAARAESLSLRLR